uniref:Ig-like domain-containing protein n=1 Tax=Seriola lalandi dorsalis TaxID=1841481 RepID=A0A3B4WMT6_SERLL
MLSFSSAGEDCETVIKVQRHTLYEAFVGQELIMNCTVAFCNSSPPSVIWYKLDQPIGPVNVSSGSHIKTVWKELSRSEGVSFLIFQKILVSDSGLYQCRSGDSQPSPHAGLHVSPRQSPSAPPSRRSTRRSTRRNAPSSQPNEAPIDNEHVYGEVKEDTERGRNAVEDEGSSVVYAALNHQPPPGAAAPRQWRREEEFSEYAAIRVS